MEEPRTTSVFEENASEIEKRLNNYVKRKVPGLKTAQQEIVADAIHDLYRTWRNHLKDGSTVTKDNLVALGYTITRNRIADFYRRKASITTHQALIEDSTPDEGPTVERTLDSQNIVSTLLDLASSLDQTERDLLNLVMTRQGSRGLGLQQTQRQQLHRLRKRLEKKLTARLGGKWKSGLEGI